MKKYILLCATLLAVTGASACGVQGSVVFSDGSKANGTERISTSWNGKEAYPRNGTYRLDLGDGVCGEKITVYLNGNQGREVRVDGWVTVNYTTK